MKPLAAFSLALLLLPAAALAQHRRGPTRPRITDRDLMFECPLEVSAACMARCQGDATAACPWAAFGCDFKVCWGTRQHILSEALSAVVDDSMTYAVPGLSLPPDHVNSLSVVRIVDGGGGFYLVNGRFVYDVYGLEPPARARALIQHAQACAATALQQQSGFISRASRASAVYWVSCGDRVAFRDITPQQPDPAEAPPAAVAVAQPEGQVSGSVSRLPDYGAIRSMSDQDLERYLTRTGHVQFSGNRVFVDGILPFSPQSDPARAQEAFAQLDDDARVALKEAYVRTVQRTLQEAQQSNPAPDGQGYVYNDETGQADLRQMGGKKGPPEGI